MLRKLSQNKEGVVFITVLMIIIVMMLLTVTIVSLNVTQTVNTEAEVRRIQAEYLGAGAVSYFYANQTSTTASNFITYTETLDGTVFTVEINLTGPGVPDYDTNSLVTDVTYN